MCGHRHLVTGLFPLLLEGGGEMMTETNPDPNPQGNACLSGWERPKLFLRGTRKTTISSEGTDLKDINLVIARNNKPK